MNFEEKRKQTSAKRVSPKQRSIAQQITFYKGLGLSGIEIYERMILETKAKLQKQMLLDRLVDLTGATPEQIEKYVKSLKAAQSDVFIQALYKQLNGKSFIK